MVVLWYVFDSKCMNLFSFGDQEVDHNLDLRFSHHYEDYLSLQKRTANTTDSVKCKLYTSVFTQLSGLTYITVTVRLK